MTLEDLLVSYNEIKPEELDNLEQRIPLFFQLLEIKNFHIDGDSSKQKTPEFTLEQPLWYFADYAGAPVLGVSPIKLLTDLIKQDHVEVSDLSSIKLSVKNYSKKINTGSLGKDYKIFKSELNKFIKNNPEYKNLELYLDGFAKLESSYNLFAINKNSNALGWFLFLDSTRKIYNKLSREEFSKDAQALLKAASLHLTSLRKQIKSWGGDDSDFSLLYAAWWRPESARLFIKDPNYDYVSPHGEKFSTVYNKAKKLMI